MYAEYIAIGCSTAIYYFFHDHPKYTWHHASGSSTSTDDAITQNFGGFFAFDTRGMSLLEQQLVVVALQVAMEIVVDFVSCVLEVVHDVPFSDFRKLGLFALLVFANCAVINIAISADMYLSGD